MWDLSVSGVAPGSLSSSPDVASLLCKEMGTATCPRDRKLPCFP